MRRMCLRIEECKSFFAEHIAVNSLEELFTMRIVYNLKIN